MILTRVFVGLISLFLLLGHTAQAVPSTTVPYQWRNVTVIAGGFVDALMFSPVQEGLAFARTDIGGAYKWDKNARRWIPLNDWAGGKDGNLLGCESVGVDPTDAKRFYLALGTYTSGGSPNGAIVGTADGGKTWHRSDVPFKMGGNEDGRSAGERLAVDPNDDRVLFFGSRNDGLWRSTDYGASWNKVSGFPVQGRTNGIGVVFVVFGRSAGKPGAPTPILYVGVSQNGPNLYRSADGGSTWEPVPGQPTGLLPHHGVLAANGAFYVTYGNHPGPNGMTDGAVWKWDTKSDVWTDITPLKPGGRGGFGYAGLALDARQPGTLMVATMDRWNPGDTLFRSRDGGQTWTDLGPQTVRDWSLTPYVTFGARTARLGWWIGALALDPFHPNHAMYGTGATIWASDDVTNADASRATHWIVGAQGIEETAVLDLVSPPAGAHLLSGLGDIGGFRHDDLNVSPSGGLWKPTVTSTTSLDFAENAPNIMARVGNGGPGAYSVDGGKSWTAFAATPPGGGRGGGTIAVSADGTTFLWSPSGAAPAVSHDRGATWTGGAGIPLGRRAVPVADRDAPNAFYLMAGNRLLASTDGGANFSERGTLPGGAQHLRATPGRAGDLWVTAGRSGVYHSTDGGATFAPAGVVSDAQRLGFGKAAPGRDYPALYLTCQTQAGASGVFRSDDVGQIWVRINDDTQQYGFSGGVVIGDPRVYGRVYLGTNGRGILYGDPVPK